MGLEGLGRGSAIGPKKFGHEGVLRNAWFSTNLKVVTADGIVQVPAYLMTL
jgi:hypothetical protein